MKIISDFIKNLGFTFSTRRLKRAIMLVVLFSLIGTGVYLFFKYESSDEGLKRMYINEVSKKYDLKDNKIIDIEKKDINDDKADDYIFIIGKEERSDNNNDVKQYDTQKDFKADVDLKICEDESQRYFLISDLSGNIALNVLNETGSLVDIIKNTTQNEFLGYTIYTSRNDENKDILKINIDNYSKDYLNEYNDTVELNLVENNIDISLFRETYLRDKFSNFELKDINNDGILEFIGYQYILYSLDETVTANKTVGVIETIFNIEENKLKFNSVNIHI